MAKTLEGGLVAPPDLRIGIVVARYNQAITQRLLDGALSGLARRGVGPERVVVAWTPGAFEIPLVARKLAETGQFDALICLGCVMMGETKHFDFVAGGAAQGIARVGLETGVPAIFAVLTTVNADQAMDRAGLKMNRGQEAAEEAIEMANLMREIRKLGTPT